MKKEIIGKWGTLVEIAPNVGVDSDQYKEQVEKGVADIVNELKIKEEIRDAAKESVRKWVRAIASDIIEKRNR